jgi:hypothetical protein
VESGFLIRVFCFYQKVSLTIQYFNGSISISEIVLGFEEVRVYRFKPPKRTQSQDHSPKGERKKHLLESLRT